MADSDQIERTPVTCDQRRAYDLRCQAEAIDAQAVTVMVELSLPVAWLLRDLLGLRGGLPMLGVRVRDDLERLNAAIPGYRASVLHGLPEPHISGWSEKKVNEIWRESSR